MEGVEQLLTPTRFSIFGYTIVVLYASTGIALVGITSKLRLSERRKFLCDFRDGLSGKNFYQAQCFEKYEQQYNAPLPLYGSVLLSFSVVLIVCFTYSWCCVKSWIDKLETVLTPDAENPRPRPRVKTRRIFSFYFLHLAARLVLGIAITAVQKYIMYPSGFPVGFTCVLKTTQPRNATGNNETHVLCHNPVASEKNTCLTAVWILQLAFAFLVLGEMFYLAVRALKRPNFIFDSEFCVKYFFHRSATAVTSGGFRERMKKRILQQTEVLEPLIHCSDETDGEGRICLDDIFLDVVIYSGRAKEEFLKQCERHQIYDFYLKPESQRGSVVVNTRAELFLSNVDAQNPRKIMVVGRPGIGKSLLCERLLRDWSRGGLFRDKNRQFKYAFLFRFRSFFAKSDERICLRKLLSQAGNLEGDLDDQVFQELLDHPEKILLVFDGLDEFKDHKSCTANNASPFGNSSSEEMPVSALYVKLLQGLLLPGATLLSTSRPTMLEGLGISLFDRTVEIMGFTEERVHTYVKNYCKHDQNNMTATRIWDHINHNLTLLSLCYIPVNCRIVCFFLKELITMSCQSSIALPTRLTEIYQGALRLLIFKHHPEYRDKPFLGNESFSESVEKHLSDLGMLAMKGIAEGRMIFGSEEVGEMKNCGLLTQMPDCRLSLVEFKQCFCFTHLTLQEFLAAREIAKMEPDKLSEFIATNAGYPKWHLVIQFVAGLLHGQQNEAVESLVSRLQETLVSRSFNRKEALLMMKCLYEYNDEATVNRAAFELQRKNNFDKNIRMLNMQITPADCVAIVYFLKHIHSIDYKLDLSRNSIGEGGCKELAKLLSKGGPVKLHVPENKITDQGLVALAQAITSDRCKLKELNIILNDLVRPEGFSHLWESFKNRNCKVIRLRLGGEQVTDKVISHLSDTLEHVNCKLTRLSFYSEEVATETALVRLFKTLKHPNCKLTCLIINCNKMTNQGVDHICEALENQNCKLTNLQLTSNRLTAVVVPLLCKAVRHDNCKLSSLKVTSWNIKWEKGGKDLQDAVEAKCRAHCSDRLTFKP